MLRSAMETMRAQQEALMQSLRDHTEAQAERAREDTAERRKTCRQTARVARETIGETLPNLETSRAFPSAEKTRTTAHGRSACQAKHHEAEAHAFGQPTIATHLSNRYPKKVNRPVRRRNQPARHRKQQAFSGSGSAGHHPVFTGSHRPVDRIH